MMHERKLNRMKGYDYSTSGAYFVTLCVRNRVENKNIFGEIRNKKMILNQTGIISTNYWLEIPNHYVGVSIDEFIIMPDHIHGIIVINDNVGTGHCPVPTDTETITETETKKNIPKYGKLSKIVKSYKNAITKYISENEYAKFQWQRSFHDHIIRNDHELNRIRQYIIDNPMKSNNHNIRQIAGEE